MDINMSLFITDNDFLVYDVSDFLNGQIEVQFDNGEFNGVICFCGNNEGDEFEVLSKDTIDNQIYNHIINTSIKNYKEMK